MRSAVRVLPLIRPWLWPVAAGLLAATYTFGYMGGHPGTITDFDQNWVAARALVEGQNPYEIIGPGRALPFPWRTAYPLTTAVACLPFALFALDIARLLFVGISVALLVWAIRPGGWRMMVPLLLSLPFMNSLWNVQWSILLTAAMARPDMLSGLAGVKPSIGPAILGACTQRRQVLIGLGVALGLLAVSLLLRPGWVPEWLASVQSVARFPAPVTRVGGPLLLLALLRWRDPRARMLAGLAVMPQTSIWYEALPLLLIPQTFKSRACLAIASQLAFVATVFYPAGWTFDQEAHATGILMQVTLFLPCLIMLFVEPGTGVQADRP